MNRVLGITFAALAMAAIAFGADNTLGTWKFNTAKSKQAAGVSPITSLTVTREAADGGATITAKGERADGSKIDTVTTAKYDGKEVAVTGEGLTWDTTANQATQRQHAYRGAHEERREVPCHRPNCRIEGRQDFDCDLQRDQRRR